jgi:hypothetical protein
MAINEDYSYERFQQANASKRVGGIDYVQSLYKSLKIPNDLVLWFFRLAWPDFIVLDNRAFIADLFDKQRYEEFRSSGHSESSAQFWTNLLEITGMFDDMPLPQALEVAQSLSSCWNSKLDKECDISTGRARVVHDEETGEVFVAIGQPD